MVFVGAVNGQIYRVNLFEKNTFGGYNTILKENCIVVEKEDLIYASHTRTISSLDISTNQQFLISASEDGSIKVWDILTRQVLHSFTHHKGEEKIFFFHIL
jgi:WD40 repeat protein